MVGGVIIARNATLTDLNGLENITSIGEFLIIDDNDSLTSLSAFSNITSVGRNLYIINNLSLASLTGLEKIILLMCIAHLYCVSYS